MMNFSLHPAFIQILSLGFVWILTHCAPMCGPIVSGLNLDKTLNGHSFKALFYYQIGRSITYVFFGIVAGGWGAHLALKNPRFGWVLVIFLLFLAMKEAFPKQL